MTPEQVKQVAQSYIDRMAVYFLPNQEIRPLSESDMSDHEVFAKLPHIHIYSHLHWMCQEIIKMADEAVGKYRRACGTPIIDSDLMEKAMRWLGFVQGVLWAMGQFSINQMRDQNR